MWSVTVDTVKVGWQDRGATAGEGLSTRLDMDHRGQVTALLLNLSECARKKWSHILCHFWSSHDARCLNCFVCIGVSTVLGIAAVLLV